MQCNNVPHTGAICYSVHPHEQLKVVPTPNQRHQIKNAVLKDNDVSNVVH